MYLFPPEVGLSSATFFPNFCISFFFFVNPIGRYNCIFIRNSSICSSVPSILRNSRYRRDQRQLDEEEEMWFNEDDDAGEVVPFSSEIITKKMDTELDSIGE